MAKTQAEEAPKTTCSFTFHAQIHPVPVPEFFMQELEGELQNPTGIWTIPPPKLSIDGLLISKECGILFEITNTEGLRYVYRSKLPLTSIILNALQGQGLSSGKSRHVRLDRMRITFCHANIDVNRRWIDSNCIPCNIDSLLSPSRPKSHTFGCFSCFSMDVLNASHYGLCVICWSCYLCYPSGGETVFVFNCPCFLSLYIIHPRSSTLIASQFKYHLYLLTLPFSCNSNSPRLFIQYKALKAMHHPRLHLWSVTGQLNLLRTLLQ